VSNRNQVSDLHPRWAVVSLLWPVCATRYKGFSTRSSVSSTRWSIRKSTESGRKLADASARRDEPCVALPHSKTRHREPSPRPVTRRQNLVTANPALQTLKRRSPSPHLDCESGCHDKLRPDAARVSRSRAIEAASVARSAVSRSRWLV